MAVDPLGLLPLDDELPYSPAPMLPSKNPMADLFCNQFGICTTYPPPSLHWPLCQPERKCRKTRYMKCRAVSIISGAVGQVVITLGADLFVGAEATPIVSPLANKISGFLIGKTVGSICRAVARRHCRKACETPSCEENP